MTKSMPQTSRSNERSSTISTYLSPDPALTSFCLNTVARLLGLSHGTLTHAPRSSHDNPNLYDKQFVEPTN
jgi:hypothetical protein